MAALNRTAASYTTTWGTASKYATLVLRSIWNLCTGTRS
jgi:hypothetical protein